MEFTRVPPAAPVAPWLGGKRQLARRVIATIEQIPHKTYAEPFVGMGGVFLRRGFRPRLEVANDINGEIINLFRVLQRHYTLLLQFMRFTLVSRAEFERLRKTDPDTLTDLERAARFLYLQRLSFGGQLGGVFGVSPSTSPRFSLAKMEPLLEAAHERLDGVVFETLDVLEFVERYDSAETLFYLDPLYIENEDDYGRGLFDVVKLRVLGERLDEINGAFVLSINDHPTAWDVFGRHQVETVAVTYTAGEKGAKAASELIISNRDLSDRLL